MRSCSGGVCRDFGDDDDGMSRIATEPRGAAASAEAVGTRVGEDAVLVGPRDVDLPRCALFGPADGDDDRLLVLLFCLGPARKSVRCHHGAGGALPPPLVALPAEEVATLLVLPRDGDRPLPFVSFAAPLNQPPTTLVAAALDECGAEASPLVAGTFCRDARVVMDVRGDARSCERGPGAMPNLFSL
eukprot:PhM_4_TR4130/c0_g1_i1/m.69866